MEPTQRSWLEHALTDPRCGCGDELGARAEYLLLRSTLEALARAITQCGVPTLAVKGAGLAHTVYDKPWHRPMGDVDLLVRRAHCQPLLGALVRHGFEPRPPPAARPRSHGAFGEWRLVRRVGGVEVKLDVHEQLDKLAARPVSHAEIFARARPLPELEPLLVPAAEDHALLVALHLATSELRHPVGLLDLAQLLRAGLELELLVERACAWKLTTALYLCFAALHDYAPALVPTTLLATLRPKRWRRTALRAAGLVPIPRAALERPTQLGWPWLVRQLAVRDDPLRWLGGIGRYAIARAEDELTRWRAARRESPRG